MRLLPLDYSIRNLGRSPVRLILSVAGSLLVSSLLGVLAGLVPAWQASRREISQCFRAV